MLVRVCEPMCSSHAMTVYSFITAAALWPFLLHGPLPHSPPPPLCLCEGLGRAGQVTVWSSCLSLCSGSAGWLLIFNFECCPLASIWTRCTACWALTVVLASHLTVYSSRRLAGCVLTSQIIGWFLTWSLTWFLNALFAFLMLFLLVSL